MHAFTPTGEFTIRRLRLNRPPLVAYRARKQSQAEELRLLVRYRDLVLVLEHLHQQHASLVQDYRALLEEQRSLLKLLLRGSE
jgi:hypothetical protein